MHEVLSILLKLGLISAYRELAAASRPVLLRARLILTCRELTHIHSEPYRHQSAHPRVQGGYISLLGAILNRRPKIIQFPCVEMSR